MRGDSTSVWLQALMSKEFDVQAIDGDGIDERDVASLFETAPFAIILPLSLPRYYSLRIAELVAVNRTRVRLILVSGTSAPKAFLEELFDVFLQPPCGVELA